MTLESIHRKALSLAAKYQLPWNYEIEVIVKFDSTGYHYRIELIPNGKWEEYLHLLSLQTEIVATPAEALHEFDVMLDENTRNHQLN